MINAFILQHKPFTPQIVKNPTAIRYIVVDLFCGAGGTTTGFAKAKDKDGNQIAIVAACVNHDHKAIRSHWENHPEVYHFEEDIRTLHLDPLIEIVKTYRKFYPNAKVVLWASLECTNFSKAKGGQSRDADSRTLADHLDRYVIAINPDYVQIENVVEFMSWGPLNEKGKPLSMKSGIDWMRWRNHIKSLGYRDDWRELNSADFGAYTSRNRLFGCFAKDGLPIVWPQPTHSKTGSNKTTLFGNDLKKWNAVKDLLNFDDEGESIFNRKKPLVENSLKRIYAGLIKEVAGGKSAFLAQYNSGKDRITSIEKPCNTIPTENRFGLVQTAFITKYFSGRPMNKIASVNSPLATITTAANQALVKVEPFVLTSSYKGVSKSVDEPVPTILATRKHHYLINPCFLTKYYGNEKGCESINDPLDTIPTKDRFSLVQAHWLDKQYSGEHNHQSINQPAGTILTSDKHALMTAKGFIYNPSHGGHTMHIEQPCATIIARQDKAPLYFIQYTIDQNVRIEIYDEDSETMVKIKEFMALYGLSDIRMRMLKVSELKLIQGFPADYKLYGNQSDQKKFIGNSVVPHVVQAWAECQGEVLLKLAA
ncbi:DNA cytosine methyltransferase [Sphingobacterium sp. 1.A.5]|uniref:DNA cytosine methyltransferase n=1 Tax=Sphingobacterium sp. 1.A.5 TaxID=2044604 RepID=UPI000C0C03BA|nr:DNA cytosine methyltransferase [Sphingobacterium sp. 1.A.5]